MKCTQHKGGQSEKNSQHTSGGLVADAPTAPAATGEARLLARGFTEFDILMCQRVMEVLANAVTDDPYSGDIELFGDDDQGRETFGLYSIQEYSAKTAAILESVTVAPVVEQDPVAWRYRQLCDDSMGRGWETHYMGREPSAGPDKKEVTPLYAAPQPVEQQPAPDVAALVEALDQCITSMLDSGYRTDAVVIRAARAALAAHRNRSES